MIPPTFDTSIPKQGHADPPGLWKTVILGSIAIHLMGLGVLHLALLGRFQDWRLSQKLMSVELITITIDGNTPPSLAATLPQTTSSRSSENQTASKKPTNPPSDAIAPKTQPSSNPSPKKVTPLTSPQPTVTTSPTAPTSQKTAKTKSPQPSKEPPNSTTPTPSSPESSEGTTQDTKKTTDSASPKNQSSGGFIATINQLNIVSSGGGSIINPQANPGDQVATIQNPSQPLSIDELTALGITLEQPLVVQVVVLINDQGKAEVIPDKTQVQQGKLNPEQAETLAQEIITHWQFSPTYMAGKPVYAAYSLTLAINPPAN